MPEVFNGVAYGSIHTIGSVTVDLRGADGSNLTSSDYCTDIDKSCAAAGSGTRSEFN